MEVEAQDREAGVKDGTPGRVLGSHQPEFSLGGSEVGRRGRACVAHVEFLYDTSYIWRAPTRRVRRSCGSSAMFPSVSKSSATLPVNSGLNATAILRRSLRILNPYLEPLPQYNLREPVHSFDCLRAATVLSSNSYRSISAIGTHEASVVGLI